MILFSKLNKNVGDVLLPYFVFTCNKKKNFQGDLTDALAKINTLGLVAQAKKYGQILLSASITAKKIFHTRNVKEPALTMNKNVHIV